MPDNEMLIHREWIRLNLIEYCLKWRPFGNTKKAIARAKELEQYVLDRPDATIIPLKLVKDDTDEKTRRDECLETSTD